MSNGAMPAPSRQGMPTGRLVAIVVAVIFGVAALGLIGVIAAGFFLFPRVHVNTVRDEQGRERSIRVETPFGRLRVERGSDVDPAHLGIPIYPGAGVVDKDTSGGRVQLDLDFAEQNLQVMAVTMETSDPFDKVVDFYREEAADFVFSRKANGSVEFIWKEGRLKKIVALRERNQKTRIALANIGEPEGN